MGDKKSNVGRPAFDYILLFKIIVLQKIYNLSDDATEYKTIWKFKNDLKNANVMKEVFNLFNTLLEEKHIITHEGTIVDATFVDVPRQRNTRKENAAIKEGKVPEEWINEGNLHKYGQKDTDARWAKKGNETHYGYKDLVKADADSKIVTDYIVTSASVHDSQEFLKLLNESDKKIYADSAFKSKKRICTDENVLKNYMKERESEVASIMLNMFDVEKELEIYFKTEKREIEHKKAIAVAKNMLKKI